MHLDCPAAGEFSRRQRLMERFRSERLSDLESMLNQVHFVAGPP